MTLQKDDGDLSLGILRKPVGYCGPTRRAVAGRRPRIIVESVHRDTRENAGRSIKQTVHTPHLCRSRVRLVRFFRYVRLFVARPQRMVAESARIRASGFHRSRWSVAVACYCGAKRAEQMNGAQVRTGVQAVEHHAADRPPDHVVPEPERRRDQHRDAQADALQAE